MNAQFGPMPLGQWLELIWGCLGRMARHKQQQVDDAGWRVSLRLD